MKSKEPRSEETTGPVDSIITKYKDETEKLKNLYLQRRSEHTKAVRKKMNKMKTVDHFNLIADIISHHQGGERFCVYYNLPFNWADQTDVKVVTELQNMLANDSGFFAMRIETSTNTIGGIRISNYNVDSHTEDMTKSHYIWHSYARYDHFSDSDGKTWLACDFDCDPRNGMVLVLFAPFIKISVFDLAVLPTMICSPHHGEHGKRMPSNPGFHIPKGEISYVPH